MKEIIQLLKEKNQTISTMESCTGGSLANELTNIEGSSEVFSFGAVTYSNEYKIKMGVPADIIEKYSVYSMETAHEMSKAISQFTSSDYGVGITGKLNRVDPQNPFGKNNIVYISIYHSKDNTYQEKSLAVTESTRKKNKELVLATIQTLLLESLQNQK